MNSIHPCNPAAYPVVVVLQPTEDDADLKLARNLWSRDGDRKISELKEVPGFSYQSFEEAIVYYKSNLDPYKSVYILVEFKSEQEAFETIVAGSFKDSFVFAIRFTDTDRKQIDAVSQALHRFLDARSHLSGFEDGIGSYAYHATNAGILNSNFVNWDATTSDITQLLEDEERLIESQINKVVDGMRLKTGQR